MAVCQALACNVLSASISSPVWGDGVDAPCSPGTSKLIGSDAMHIVELRYSEDALPGIAGTVRRWLDTGKTQPTTFRYSLFGTATVLRVDFELEAEAQAFARAFGGIVLA